MTREQLGPNRVVPSQVAVLAVQVAVLALPAGDVRSRWERELTAQLYGLDVPRQAAFAVTTLLSAWSLRRAVNATPTTGMTMTINRPPKPLGCTLNIGHHYVQQTNPDGQHYSRCTRCGKDKYDGPYIGGIAALSLGPTSGWT